MEGNVISKKVLCLYVNLQGETYTVPVASEIGLFRYVLLLGGIVTRDSTCQKQRQAVVSAAYFTKNACYNFGDDFFRLDIQ